jgi:hypothetical protein
MSDKRKSENAMAGMKRAMMHALDMNHNGRLDDKELNEFRRFIVGQAMNEMPMEHHVTAKKNGDIEYLSQAAGYDDDDERDPFEIEKSRKGTAAKIVADYLGKLWNEGHIDDDTYIAEMQKVGAADIRDEDEADPKDIAAKVWAAANSAEELTAAQLGRTGGSPEGEQIDEETASAFYKRNPSKRRE